MKTQIDLMRLLDRQIEQAQDIVNRPMSVDEMSEFKSRHPWADLVVGDFEIRVINREKYGLDPQ